ncbi:MAG: primase-helicase family protein [Bacteroidia bacterium]
MKYCESRLSALGISEPENALTVTLCDVEFPGSPVQEHAIFEADSNDNIKIYYPSLNGDITRYPSKHKYPKPLKFFRTRLHPDNVVPDANGKQRKYNQAQGTGIQIFFPPKVIQAYREKKKAETLVIVEGEFKAFKLSLHGICAIGIGGIQLFVTKAGEKEFHPDIVELINVLEPQNIILLHDADAKQVTWDPEKEPEKDLGRRLASFHYAVNLFKTCTHDMPQMVYYAHVHDKYIETAKGVDDLLCEFKGNENAIVEDLLSFNKAKTFFHCINLSNATKTALREEFLIEFNFGTPIGFYNHHKNLLEEHEFTFLHGRYRWVDGEGLVMEAHPEAKKFKRIGCDYYKVIEVPNKHKELEKSMKLWKVGEISRDYVTGGKKIKNFFDMIEKYDAPCNVPENEPEKYEQVINGCYNFFFPPKYAPTKPHNMAAFEEESLILKFIKHIFQDKYIVGLDYLSILFRYPKQILPILCLVSKENNTGKTTFFKLLKAIWGENATVLGNEQFQNKFNRHYITKFLIMLDEGFIPVHKKEQKERIKMLGTAETALLEGKGSDVVEVDYFGKFMMSSNDEENFMAIDQQDIRFMVLKVPTIPAELYNPDLLTDMKAEIPAFLHLLKTREIVHHKKDRAWFSFSEIATDALRRVVSSTRPFAEKAIHDVIADYFKNFGMPVYHVSQEQLFDKIKDKFSGNFKVDKNTLAKTIKDCYKREPGKARKYRHAEFAENVMDDDKINISFTSAITGRPYTFFIDEFLSPDEIQHLQMSNHVFTRLNLTPEEKERCSQIFTLYPGLVEAEKEEAEMPF